MYIVQYNTIQYMNTQVLFTPAGNVHLSAGMNSCSKYNYLNKHYSTCTDRRGQDPGAAYPRPEVLRQVHQVSHTG